MHPPAALATRDRVALALLVFFFTIAFSFELYWLLYRDELVQRAPTDFFARAFQVYGDCDRGYYDRISPTAVGLEWINVYLSQLLNVWLFVAIVNRARHRYVLQLVLGSYLAYSVVLYFLSAHLSGYADMRYLSPWTFFLFFGANAPWLLGYGWLAWDAARALLRRDDR